MDGLYHPRSKYRSISTYEWILHHNQTRTIAQANAQPITMNNGAGQALALTSVLSANGSSFSVERTSVPAPLVSPGGRRFSRGNGP